MIVSVLDKVAGFYSILFFTINHYMACKKNNTSFKIDSSEWLFKSVNGWTDYFRSIDFTGDPEHDSGEYVLTKEEARLIEIENSKMEFCRFELDIIPSSIISICTNINIPSITIFIYTTTPFKKKSMIPNNDLDLCQENMILFLFAVGTNFFAKVNITIRKNTSHCYCKSTLNAPLFFSKPMITIVFWT